MGNENFNEHDFFGIESAIIRSLDDFLELSSLSKKRRGFSKEGVLG
jgi:hypothetical protein